MPRGDLRSWDVLLAVAGTLAVVVEGALRGRAGLSPAAYPLALVAGAPLAFRTRAPLAAFVAVGTGAVACAIVLHASWTVTGLVVIQLYTVALLGDRQRSLVIGTVTAVVVVVTILFVDGGLDPQAMARRLPLVFLSLAIGDTVRSRQALRVAAQERAEREAREQEAEVRRQAAAERLRIARELHDTLGHSLVAINVRASVAIDLWDSKDSAAALEDIKQASAGALRDLRATLTLLRDQNDGVPTAPVLDLAALPGLVRHSRSAGLEVEVDIDAGATALPSAISGAAFRIVQEALTNVLRHANASSAHVCVRARSDALDVEITDDGTGRGVAAAPGFGLRGMAERVAALGGRLEAGPREDRGWRVHAVLPLRGGAVR
ncbi:MAG TPA: histidine kinase [Candidatus Dormibacteraeota bacterium]